MTQRLIFLLVVSLILGFGVETASSQMLCPIHKFTSPWETGQVLWKPVSEYFDSPVVCTLPREDVKIVSLRTKDNKLIAKIPFRSVGDAGDCWQNYTLRAKKLKADYGQIFLRVVDDDGCKKYLIKDPCKRSDNRSGEGNCINE